MLGPFAWALTIFNIHRNNRSLFSLWAWNMSLARPLCLFFRLSALTKNGSYVQKSEPNVTQNLYHDAVMQKKKKKKKTRKFKTI